MNLAILGPHCFGIAVYDFNSCLHTFICVHIYNVGTSYGLAVTEMSLNKPNIYQCMVSV